MLDRIPQVFVSYSWTCNEYQESIVALATRLRHDGVNVKLDVWDLKHGQDKYAYMEQCVTNPNIDKVLIMSDRVYTEKADARKGGVGDETSVISAEVYKNVNQQKFIPVVMERNEEGEEFLPAYLKSRMYIDFSVENKEKAYKELLRAIFELPEQCKPDIGNPPKWLTEEISDSSYHDRRYLKDWFQNSQNCHSYTRVCDSSTSIDKSTDKDQVEEALWKQRFEIDKTAIEKFGMHLRDIDRWESVDGGQTFFYNCFPEFQIKIEIEEEKNGYEYFCFSQISKDRSWWRIILKYRDTILKQTVGISLDGGDFFTAVPCDSFLLKSDLFYCYIRGTLQYDLNQFFLSKMTDTLYDSKSRWEACIPVFNSKDEKERFVKYLETAELRPVTNYNVFVPDILSNGELGKGYKRQYALAMEITEQLNIFRTYAKNDIVVNPRKEKTNKI